MHVHLSYDPNTCQGSQGTFGQPGMHHPYSSPCSCQHQAIPSVGHQTMSPGHVCYSSPIRTNQAYDAGYVYHHQAPPTAFPPGPSFPAPVTQQQQQVFHQQPSTMNGLQQQQTSPAPPQPSQQEIRLQAQVEDLTKELSRYQKYHEEDVSLASSLRQQLNDLREESRTNDDRMKTVIHEMESKIRDLNKEVRDRDNLLEEKTNNLETLSSDLRKANEIIRKLQEQVDKSQTKLNLLTEVSSRQEDLVSEKVTKMKELESDLKLCIKKITEKEQLQAKLSEDLERVKDQLKEAKETISTNESLIHFLNKQLAAKDMTGKTISAGNAAAQTAIKTTGISNAKQTALMQQQIKALKLSSQTEKQVQQLMNNMNNGHTIANEVRGTNGVNSSVPFVPPEPTAAPRLVQFHGLPTVNAGDTGRITTNNKYQRNPLVGRTTTTTIPATGINTGFITNKGVK